MTLDNYKLSAPTESDYFTLEGRYDNAKDLVRYAAKKVEFAEEHCVTFRLLYSQTELQSKVDWAKKVLERCKRILSTERDRYIDAEEEFHNSL